MTAPTPLALRPRTAPTPATLPRRQSTAPSRTAPAAAPVAVPDCPRPRLLHPLVWDPSRRPADHKRASDAIAAQVAAGTYRAVVSGDVPLTGTSGWGTRRIVLVEDLLRGLLPVIANCDASLLAGVLLPADRAAVVRCTATRLQVAGLVDAARTDADALGSWIAGQLLAACGPAQLHHPVAAAA